MLIGELPNWPPVPAKVPLSPRAGEGDFTGCTFVPALNQVPSHLIFAITFLGRKHLAVFNHPSDKVLQEIDRSLKHRSGDAMWKLNAIRLCAMPNSSST